MDALVQNEELCDRFEEVWLGGTAPSLKEFIETVSPQRRTALFRQLLELDLVYRHQRGQPKSAAEYRAECPDLAVVIDAVFAARSLRPSHSAVLIPPKLNQSQHETPPVGHGSQYVHSLSARTHDQIGNYELLGEIARGGMGVVFRARQRGVNRLVAVKMMLAGRFASQEEMDRFNAEVRTVGQLDHPNIVPIYEVGVEQGVPYFSMALVEGPSLSDRIRQSPLTSRESARILAAVADAVSFAHSQGVIHRDLKPQNILLTSQGEPRVTDFGLAKQTSKGAGPTLTGQVLGTPSYMSPEQAAGKTALVGPATDVYSLGATLYAMLTGRAPFQAQSWQQTMKQVQEHEPVAPRLLNPTIDRDLEQICLKCLQKSIGDRYASPAELASDLRRFLSGQPVTARPLPWSKRTLRWVRGHPRESVLGVSLSVVVLSAGFIWALMASNWATESARRAAVERQSLAQSLQRRTAYCSSLMQIKEADHPRQNAVKLLNPFEFPFSERDFAWQWLLTSNQSRFATSQTSLLEKFTLSTTGEATHVAISPDGSRLAALIGSEVALFALPTGSSKPAAGKLTALRLALPVNGPLQELCWSADSRELLLCEGSLLSVHRFADDWASAKSDSYQLGASPTAMTDGKSVPPPGNRRIKAAAISPQGDLLAGADDNAVKIWARADAGLTAEAQLLEGDVRDLAWHPTEPRIYVVMPRNVTEFVIRGTGQGRKVERVGTHRFSNNADFDRALVTSRGNLIVRHRDGMLWTLTPTAEGDSPKDGRTAWDEQVWMRAAAKSAGAFSLTSDGKNLLTLDDSRLQVWDVVTQQPLATIEGLGSRGDSPAALSNRGRDGFCAFTGSNIVTRCQLPASVDHAIFPVDARQPVYEHVEIGPDDQLWQATSSRIILWDLQAGFEPRQLTEDWTGGDQRDVTALSVSPGGDDAAVAVSQFVRRFRKTSSQPVTEFQSLAEKPDLARQQMVLGLECLPNDVILAARSDSTIEFWRGTRKLQSVQLMGPGAAGDTIRYPITISAKHYDAAAACLFVAIKHVSAEDHDFHRQNPTAVVNGKSPVMPTAIWQVEADETGKLGRPIRWGDHAEGIMGLDYSAPDRRLVWWDTQGRGWYQTEPSKPREILLPVESAILGIAQLNLAHETALIVTEQLLYVCRWPVAGQSPVLTELGPVTQGTEGGSKPPGTVGISQHFLRESSSGRWVFAAGYNQPIHIWSVPALLERLVRKNP